MLQAFTASSILRTHIRQHSGERPFKCKHCGKAFASHAAHDSHVRRSHAKDKPHACELCDGTFEHAEELQQHLNIHKSEYKHITGASVFQEQSQFKRTHIWFKYLSFYCSIFGQAKSWCSPRLFPCLQKPGHPIRWHLQTLSKTSARVSPLSPEWRQSLQATDRGTNNETIEIHPKAHTTVSVGILTHVTSLASAYTLPLVLLLMTVVLDSCHTGRRR